MGASESTARPNATNNEEEDNSQQQNSSSVGSYIGAAAAVATAAVGVAVAVHGISKMLSDNTDNQQRAQNEIERSSFNSPNLIAAGPSGMMRYRSKWSPPPAGHFKMNTDGGCHPVVSDYGVKRGPSGYGGILRDHLGNWVQGFIGFIGESDCLTSEFYGILKGLEVLDKLKLKGSILETDCQPAYEWVNGQDDHRGKSEIIRACWPIIIKCRQLANKNEISITLVTGDDANQCADTLANMAIGRKEPYVEIKNFEDVPYGLRLLVAKDGNFNVRNVPTYY